MERLPSNPYRIERSEREYRSSESDSQIDELRQYSIRQMRKVRETGRSLHEIGMESDSFLSAEDHISSLLKSGVIPYCRVSVRSQAKRGNLDSQKEFVRIWCNERDIRIHEVFEEVGSGWLPNRPQYDIALAKAKELGVPLLAATVPRFIRSADLNNKSSMSWNASLSREELAAFSRKADSVLRFTIVHPRFSGGNR